MTDLYCFLLTGDAVTSMAVRTGSEVDPEVRNNGRVFGTSGLAKFSYFSGICKASTNNIQKEKKF